MKKSIYISSFHFFFFFFVDLSIYIRPFEGTKYVKSVIIKACHYPVCESFSPKNELRTLLPPCQSYRMVLVKWSLETRQNALLKSLLNF